MVAITPMFISALMTSLALTAIFCASSATVTVSPMPNLVHQRRGRHLESMPSFGGRRRRPRLGAALLLVARADIPGDVQLLAAITGVLLVIRHGRDGNKGRSGARAAPPVVAG